MRMLQRCLPLAFIFILLSCGKNREDSRYVLIGHHWVESGRQVNGEERQATQLQHIFFSGGQQGRLEYEYVCGVAGDDCLPGQRFFGSWQLLTDSTLSTNLNGAIRIFEIKRLTASELWLEYQQGTDAVLSKMIRYR